jgi:hypothetical protein
MEIPKIVTHPLGLVGYALALVFGLLGKYGPSDRWPWLLPAALAMSLLCVLGGLILASRQIGAKSPNGQPTDRAVIQRSGDQSPNIANAAGPINIDYGSTTKPSTHKKA